MHGVFPLWQRDTEELAREMLDAGIVATLTCVDPRRLDRHFVGRRWDATLLRALPPSVDPCGENGEFHTVVTSSPLFRGPIATTVGDVVERDGFAFADVLLADLELREETAGDRPGVRVVNEAAFGTSAEADLVDALRRRERVVVSAVAIRDDTVVGHALLSTARIVGPDRTTACLALGPMAVAPEAQRQGIGTRIVAYALGLARARGHRVVIVLGHPDYYPRFGFEVASTHGVRTKYAAADSDAFMIIGLDPSALDGIAGSAAYAPEFDEV
jgi:putative acetyltransferase